jgi:DNA repair protein RecN (Recombination protein N)
VITHLHIRNFAIIKSIDIQFQSGLTIITGETGAGKSIIIGALSLILGERADSNAILNPAEKCIIEGRFSIAELNQVKSYLEEHDFDLSNELIIRRELASNGKSRVFINDTPTTLGVLSSLAELLIDLHRQFDNLEIQQTSNQLNTVDQIASIQNQVQDFQTQYTTWRKLNLELDTLQKNNIQIRQEADYNQFLFDELHALNLAEQELETLEHELTILNSSEALKSGLQKSMMLVQDDEEPIVQKLKMAISSIEPYAKILPIVDELITRLHSSLVELKDIGAEMNTQFDEIFYDEERIATITERINEGNRLLKKHHVQTTSELISIKNSLEEKISNAIHADEDEIVLKEKIEKLHTLLIEDAKKLSTLRATEIVKITNAVNLLLPKVGMPNATLKIAQTDINLNLFGKDRIEFLIDTNKTGKFQPVAKAASGGELSRLILCIKSLQASSTQMPTLIFDEIDTGISGETAIQVGLIMQELSKHHQLLCITHLPQIASKANQHLYIYKAPNQAGEINTHVKELNQEDRINVLSEMLSGKDSNDQARQMVIQLMK